VRGTLPGSRWINGSFLAKLASVLDAAFHIPFLCIKIHVLT
jgi:hypothetical protein